MQNRETKPHSRGGLKIGTTRVNGFGTENNNQKKTEDKCSQFSYGDNGKGEPLHNRHRKILLGASDSARSGN